MRLTIAVDTDGAAFEDNPNELHEVLAKVADKAKWGNSGLEGKALDSEGNTCARWEWTDA